MGIYDSVVEARQETRRLKHKNVSLNAQFSYEATAILSGDETAKFFDRLSLFVRGEQHDFQVEVKIKQINVKQPSEDE